MIQAEIKYNIHFPKEIISKKDLMDIARSIFIPALRGGIEDQEAITGGPYPPLEPSTIKAKIKKGYGDLTLIATNRLKRSFQAKNGSGTSVIIYLSPDRKKIGTYLQIDGVGKKNKHFNFFGINDSMEKAAGDYLKMIVAKVADKFNGR